MKRYWKTALLFLLVTSINGCRSVLSISLAENAQEFEIYSLDPILEHLKPNPSQSTLFHGYAILQSLKITEMAERTKIFTAMEQGVRENQNVQAACFSPRHGLRIKTKLQTVDYVICFECLHIEVYNNGWLEYLKTSRTPQPVFDEALKIKQENTAARF